MHSFPFYLQLGFEHISNLGGYDHILFLIALCAVYRIEQWRNIVVGIKNLMILEGIENAPNET
ncbi:MAG: HupE/UreJ family protein, partial [Bacteroidota bacterium]